MTATSLSLCVHLLDGRQLRFEQNDAKKMGDVLREAQKKRVFDQPLLSLCGDYSVTGIATRSVVKIDFLMNEPPGWAHPPGIDRVTRISREKYDSEANLGTNDERHRRERPHQVGELTVDYLRLDFLGDDTDYFEVYSRIGSALDERRTLSNLYGSRCLHADYPGVGATLYNTQAIERLTLIPGPHETPDGAWCVHHVGETSVVTPTE